MNKKTALIFGVTGQDGAFLAPLLLEKDYEVYGVARRVSTTNTQRIDGLKDNPSFHLIEGDIIDPSSVYRIFSSMECDECYNLAAQSHVGTSFSQPSLTWQVTAGGVLNILEAIRLCSPHTKFYQASSSEMFGNEIDDSGFQTENTPLKPVSPYAVAKTAAHHLVNCYRTSYNIFACAGILFNHESEYRGENFVTRKITKYVAKLNKHNQFNKHNFFTIDDYIEYPKLKLGNLDARRDWGYAGDYVEAMWMMLQQGRPDDYVIATGETHSIKDFLSLAFAEIGIKDYMDYIEIDPQFIRPYEVKLLKGYAGKANSVLDWFPKTSFKELVHRMVWSDINGVAKESRQSPVETVSTRRISER